MTLLLGGGFAVSWTGGPPAMEVVRVLEAARPTTRPRPFFWPVPSPPSWPRQDHDAASAQLPIELCPGTTLWERPTSGPGLTWRPARKAVGTIDRPRSRLGLTIHHANRDVLVDGPDIVIEQVGSRAAPC